MGKDARRFRFEEMLATFNEIINGEDLPKDKISVKTQALLHAYLFEKSKAETIKRFEENSK